MQRSTNSKTTFQDGRNGLWQQNESVHSSRYRIPCVNLISITKVPLVTRRPLSTGVFSAKNVTHQHGFEPTTSCLPLPTALPSNLNSQVTNSQVEWMEIVLDIWQKFFKKRNTDYDFPPPLNVGGK